MPFVACQEVESMLPQTSLSEDLIAEVQYVFLVSSTHLNSVAISGEAVLRMTPTNSHNAPIADM